MRLLNFSSFCCKGTKLLWLENGVNDEESIELELSKHVTNLLDGLLKEDRYDKRIRPNFGGPPVTIEVNMYIKSLGPVSETDEVYSMDCYFRQMWVDNRLKFNASATGLSEFSMNWLFLDKVWKPDTYFVNGKKSYLHSITVPNKFLRLRQDGLLTYSMRLTIKASCPMHLRKFPLDSQSCPLEIGSCKRELADDDHDEKASLSKFHLFYGYSNNDVLYAWFKSGKDPVGREEGVNLAQYDLTEIKTKEEIRLSSRRDNFSVVAVHFHLKRHTGYFMLQVYVPCTLIVSCSWVSFWIDPQAVPARVSLGVTTVLSMTTLGFGGRSQMPRTSYATALDWFVIICFSFVFASMVEYAAINFLDKMTKDVAAKATKKKRPPSAEGEAQPSFILIRLLRDVAWWFLQTVQRSLATAQSARK
ncbi:Gamma-aminobutyric acid receptor subunit alpha-6 [Orchesella cincta]|uniref:Gamma-aminobutyric acid receptor subunit alpha-6 n=1 Tax=Orchesella cincta TaxID=48709 RepID=A0A1D2MAU3_ORCCI|nr:Gamma-aminobutyric acid receptor subunit alpha-6 [Orchesella cincta]